jgi:PPE-repeat protein
LKTDRTISGWDGVQTNPGTAPVPPTEFPAIITNPGPLAATAPTMSAALGEANTVGALSVPSGWTVATPGAVRPVALEVSTTSAGVAAAEAMEGSSGNVFSELGLAGMAGSGLAGQQGGGADGDRTKIGQQLSARAGGTAADAPIEGTPAPRLVLTGIAARIREIAGLRDQGILTDEEYTAEKNRLLGR